MMKIFVEDVRAYKSAEKEIKIAFEVNPQYVHLGLKCH